MDKFRKELVMYNVSINVVHTNQEICGYRGGFSNARCRGRAYHVTNYGRGRNLIGNRAS